MTRLAATVRIDLRVQARNGFYLAAAVIAAFSILLLCWLPAETAQLLLPVVIVQNVLTNGFYFVSGLLLLERVEGTFAAQCVTPLRPAEYLASKVGTLTALSLIESTVIAAVVLGIGPWLIGIAAGIALAAVLFCLAGVALVLRYESINEFLMPSVVYAFALTLPIFGVFGLGGAAWYVAHPIHGPLSLMTLAGPSSIGGYAYAIAYPLLWTVPAYLVSRHALLRARRT